MRTFLAFCSYDGSKFDGFQRQTNTHNTIQQYIEDSLYSVYKKPIQINASGRTDKGAHAISQPFSFEVDGFLEPEKLKFVLNNSLSSRTSGSIYINDIIEKDLNFHARYSAKSKKYKYLIYISQNVIPILEPYYLRLNEMPDLKKLEMILKTFHGTHDFYSFQAKGSPKKTTVRTVVNTSYKFYIQKFPQIADKVQILELEITADGFLYKMARAILGVTLAFSLNKLSEDFVANALNSHQDGVLKHVLPASGLYLAEVYY